MKVSKSKLIKTLLFFSITCLISYLFTWWNDHDSHPYYTATNLPLKDRIIEKLPVWGPRRFMNGAIDTPEFVILGLTVYIMGYGIMTSNYDVLLNFAILLSIGYLIRVCTIYVTVFPRLDNKQVSPRELSLKVSGGNYDLTSSGHMMCTTLIVLFLVGSFKQSRYLYLFLPLYAILLLLYRSHYTIDIMNGFMIALLLYLLRKHII